LRGFRGAIDKRRKTVCIERTSSARIEIDIGIILTISVAISVQPKLSRNMSTCPDRGIAGQVDMLFATFKSGRGTKRSASAPFMENGSHSATMR
jgi:hypothetical protein